MSYADEQQEALLKKALLDGWGYAEYREYQLDACKSVLQGRDAMMCLATGAGKSLCYQVPAWAAKKTVLVVSPLISLMQDQVHRLNRTLEDECAVYLGSAQFDPNAEANVFAGKYIFVYVTPEKLASSGFLDRCKTLHSQGKLLLMAVDEAHCISSWGHDFRKEFRLISDFRSVIPACPIMALTATAVPRVRDDIIKTLSMRAPHVAQSSYDRTNLEIKVCVKKGGREEEVTKMAKEIRTQPIDSSTIVYCATTREVDSISESLSGLLRAQGRKVVKYHGSMGPVARKESHVAFLTGQAPVIVATEAFGMGIDKPDIRKIYNFGPPKTFESYYQQIGRAGRDGLPASCTLVFADTEFAKYQDDFYTAKLTSAGALEAYKSSSGKFRTYANDMTSCRRAAIIHYLSGGQEQPSFGDRCGTCDTCRVASKFGDDASRDYTSEAIAVFAAVRENGNSTTKTQLIDTIKRAQQGKAKVPGGHFVNWYKEFLPALKQSGFLMAEGRKSGGGGSGGFSRSYELLYTTPKAQNVMRGHANVVLPVPQCVRDAEAAKIAKTEALKKELQVGGIDTRLIPQQELKDGTGPVLKAELNWLRMIARTKERDPKRAGQLEMLAARIAEWRAKQAAEFSMAPGAVLANHLIKAVAYSQPSTVDVLRTLGARVGDLAALIAIISGAKTEFGWNLVTSSSGGGGGGGKIKFAPGAWGPNGSAVKPITSKKLPHWVALHKRFANGESIEAIAVTGGARGQAVQVNTITSHMLTAMQHGKNIDLVRLAAEGGAEQLPSQDDWRQFNETISRMKVDIQQDPIPKNEIAGEIVACAKIPYADRNDAQKAECKVLFGKFNWYFALKRSRYSEQTLLALDKAKVEVASTAAGGGGGGGAAAATNEHEDELEQMREMEAMEAEARDTKRRKVESAPGSSSGGGRSGSTAGGGGGGGGGWVAAPPPEVAAAAAAAAGGGGGGGGGGAAAAAAGQSLSVEEEEAMIAAMMDGLDESALFD